MKDSLCGRLDRSSFLAVLNTLLLLCLAGLAAFMLLPHGMGAITGVGIVALRHQVAQQPRQPQSNSWPTDGADPAGTSCRDGFLTSPRHVFWQWANDTGPTLTELYNSGEDEEFTGSGDAPTGRGGSRLTCRCLAAEDRLYAVFSIKMTSREHHTTTDELVSGDWRMEFKGVPELGFLSKTVNAYDIGR